MPTYEYACDSCDHKWEEFQSIKAEATKKCPSCKKQKARRLISAGGGFLFKGTGFYLTDYRSESYKAGAKADSASKPDSVKTESTKSDAPAKAESPAPKAGKAKPAE